MVELAAVAEPTPDNMRNVLGTFATGVTVVTSMDEDEPVGFTCQAFSGVSLDPPFVLFCADHRGSTWPRIRRNGLFVINILEEGQQHECMAFGSRSGTKFAELDWHTSPEGLPVLDGVLARVHAEVETVHAAGDHDIVLGRVFALESVRAARPMVFYQGRFTLDPRDDEEGDVA